MSYTIPPTFADDAVLSASQLNILSADIEYLYGLAAGVNVPTAKRQLSMQDTSSFWQIRHRAAWLNIYAEWNVDATWVDHMALRITVGGTDHIDVDPWVPGVSSPAYLAYDVSALTPGTWYEIEIRPVPHTGAHAHAGTFGDTYFNVLRIFESDTDYS